ncbi:MAG: alkaline phosphatase family protein [Candidatus Coatesbacteria bacterium]|nr:alkaline phosphatase family protein [Candidatus Coatesbacteria bacterium]
MFAYVGPGAGFAFVGSFFILFISLFIAFLALLSLPLRLLFKRIFGKRLVKKPRFKKIIIIGFDGMDYGLTSDWIEKGYLPHLKEIADKGSYLPLRTTTPSISPVAWSSFQTGVHPAKHNIFDFLARNPQKYEIDLSSARVFSPSKHFKIGKYRIPRNKGGVRLLRGSKPFWIYLGEHGILSQIIRVPITFPPESFAGMSLSAMCTPDILGTQGTFYYCFEEEEGLEYGRSLRVRRDNNKVSFLLEGPQNPFSDNGDILKVPVSLILGTKNADMHINGVSYKLEINKYSEWIRINFKMPFGKKFSGIALFYLISVKPFKMYISPIQIDPENPVLPISAPLYYSSYIAKKNGLFSTLGLAEDTWGLESGILTEEAFCNQVQIIHEERKKMFFDALDKKHDGLVCCVFDFTDRLQHTFFRYIDESHPQFRESKINVILESYKEADKIVGNVIKHENKDTLIMIISDHGFKSFRRCVDINRWLSDQGYLVLKEAESKSEYLQNIDWEKTRAYAFGLSGLYINLEGREGKGTVKKEEYYILRQEIKNKLEKLMDKEKECYAIKEAILPDDIYKGPYIKNAPDIIIGYNEGYRISWTSVVGGIGKKVFEDNNKYWSGDHSIHPALVDGVFFSSNELNAETIKMIDIAPIILDLWGIKIPDYMDGEVLSFKEK